MAALSSQLAALLSLNLGYISGGDLSMWCNPELLITRQNIQPNSLQKGVDMAIAEVQSALQTHYDLRFELSKSDILTSLALTVLTGGAVTAVNVTRPGSGYISAPVVTVTNDPKDTIGAGAVLTAIVSQSVISSILVIGTGRRYTSIPTVVIEGGGGSGAAATAILGSNGRITGVTVTAPGTGYTSTPLISFAGGGGVGATAQAIVGYGQVTGFTINTAGTGYTLPPLVSLSGGQGTDTRNAKLVKICSIWAVRNIMGNAQNISDKMKQDFKDADSMVDDIKGGEDSLPLLEASTEMRSDLLIIPDRFKTLG